VLPAGFLGLVAFARVRRRWRLGVRGEELLHSEEQLLSLLGPAVARDLLEKLPEGLLGLRDVDRLRVDRLLADPTDAHPFRVNLDVPVQASALPRPPAEALPEFEVTIDRAHATSFPWSSVRPAPRSSTNFWMSVETTRLRGT